MANGKDTTFKYIGKEFLSVFFSLTQESDENDAEEFEEITEELISLKIAQFHPDFAAKSKYRISMYEFMSTYLRLKDKKRFLTYISLFDFDKNDENLEINFNVISTVQKSGVIHHKIGDIVDFKINVVNIRDFGFAETINMARDKIKNKEIFNAEELVKLALTSIMPKTKEAVKKQFYVLLDMKEDIIFENNDAKDSFLGIALILSDTYFDPDDPIRKEIQDDFMNRIDCVTERMDEIREETREKTREKTKIESGINALEKGISIEIAADIAGISQEKLEEEYSKFLAEKS